MADSIILASGSVIRRQLLERAGVELTVKKAAVDEELVGRSLQSEGTSARNIADALAEAKARKVGLANPAALVIGCDQVLDHHGRLVSKARTRQEARALLAELRGDRHKLHSAAVIFHDGRAIWRQVGTATLTMRAFSDAYLDDYLDRNWDSVRDAVGCYKLEEEGPRLFSRVEGDYFHVLGLPLLELLGYLTVRGVLKG